jgi:hypothetical protein
VQCKNHDATQAAWFLLSLEHAGLQRERQVGASHGLNLARRATYRCYLEEEGVGGSLVYSTKKPLTLPFPWGV